MNFMESETVFKYTAIQKKFRRGSITDIDINVDVSYTYSSLSSTYFKTGKNKLYCYKSCRLLWHDFSVLKNEYLVSYLERNTQYVYSNYIANIQIDSGQRYENFRGKKIRAATYNCTVNSRIGPLDRSKKPGK